MCFSAPASFIAGTSLAVIGTIAIRKSVTVPLRVFASIPLLFAIQQFSEGGAWLSFHQPEYAYLRAPCMYIFLFFAQVVWPIFVPLSVLLLEETSWRKKILRVLTGIGAIVGLYLLYCLFAYPVSASAEGHHISYDLEFSPSFQWMSGLLYLLAAVLSPFLSGHKKVRLLGALLLVSYMVTRIFYKDYLVSVWCYFAAILSLFILWIVLQLRKEILKVTTPMSKRNY